MVKVNKGLLAGQTLGNEFSKLFPTPGKTISGVSYLRTENEEKKIAVMFCAEKVSIDGDVTVKKASRKINIDEGLLKNQSFLTNDIQEIRINEGIDCYGAAAFTFGFSLGFKS